MKKMSTAATGLAMFTMLFGAGNIIYPLELGRSVGGNILIALLGFSITAAILPLIGFIASLLCDGDYAALLGRAGKPTAFCVAFVCMILVGPFCAIPRCITLAHSVMTWYMPSVNLVVFSAISALLIFGCTVKKSRIVPLLGKVFGPIKIILLSIIIIAGLISTKTLLPAANGLTLSLYKGLMDGYGTMDLLGTIFFAGMIAGGMKLGSIRKGTACVKDILMVGLKVGSIGCGLLVLVYIGFGMIAARYAEMVQGLSSTELFSALTSLVLGSYGGLIASVTVFITCFTTAIVLSAIFADYMRHNLLSNRWTYLRCLKLTVAISFVFANFGFAYIMKVVEPVIMVFYPGLVFLALINIIYVVFIDKRSKRSIIASIMVTDTQHDKTVHKNTSSDSTTNQRDDSPR